MRSQPHAWSTNERTKLQRPRTSQAQLYAWYSQFYRILHMLCILEQFSVFCGNCDSICSKVCQVCVWNTQTNENHCVWMRPANLIPIYVVLYILQQTEDRFGLEQQPLGSRVWVNVVRSEKSKPTPIHPWTLFTYFRSSCRRILSENIISYYPFISFPHTTPIRQPWEIMRFVEHTIFYT